ncbi:MAG: type II secretion system F family protein [Neisseriaceae bacterium]
MTAPRPEPRLWVYRYRLVDLSLPQPEQQGWVVATTVTAARALLAGPQRQLLWLRRRWWPLSWSVGTAEVLLFSQQLAALLKAGLPLLQVLGLLAASQPGALMRQLLQQIQQEVAQGRSLTQAVALYQPLFGGLYVAVLAAGELSGCLDEALEDLVHSLTKRQHLQRQLRLALAYPALILSLAGALVLGLIVFVLPSFVTLYEGMGVALPLMTLWLLALVEWAADYALLIWLSPVVLMVVWRRLYARHRGWALWWAQQGLRLPFLGPLRQKIILTRWAHTFAMLHAAGLPLLSLLTNVAQVSQHLVYDLATQAVSQSVSEGQSLYQAMRTTACFPELLLQLVLAGEESGALDELLHRAAVYYGAEVDQSMALLSVWIEPLLLLCLGVIVGVVLLALYLPLFNIGDVIG